MISKRTVLQGFSSTAALFALGGPSAMAQAAGTRRVQQKGNRGEKPFVVDIHAHVYSLEVDKIISSKKDLKLNWATQQWGAPHTVTIEERLRDMDILGVSMHALTPSGRQYYYGADRTLASEIVSAHNESLAAICAAHPQKFVGLGVVSLQYPEMAAEQLTKAVRQHGLKGVAISTNVNGEELAKANLDPFWAAAEELDILIYMHPLGFSHPQRLQEHFMSNSVGQPLESAIALAYLVYTGVLDRFPRLKLCTAHGGGYFPAYIGRFDLCRVSGMPECQKMQKSPSEYLPQLYFDSTVHSPAVLLHLVNVAGASQVLFGTDYPSDPSVMKGRNPVDVLLEIEELSTQQKSAILGENAARVLKLTR